MIPIDYDHRMEYYNQGLTDKQIAAKANLTPKGVASWRRRHNLPCNYLPNGRKITNEEYMQFYERGLNDMEIAERLGTTKRHVESWRNKHKLIDNKKVVVDNRLELYRQGMNDREISRQLGLPKDAIKNWRYRQGLKSNLQSQGHKASICWSCTRANARPDPYGCGFHRKKHTPIYDAAEKLMVTDSHSGLIEVTVVTKCKYYEVSMRDLRDRQRGNSE